MDLWKTEVVNLFQFLMGSPQTAIELFTILILSIATFILVLKIVGGILGCAMADFDRAAVVFVITLLITFLSVVATRLYLSPLLSSEMIREIIPWVFAAVLCLVIVAPAACFTLKGKYGAVAVAILISMAATVGIVAVLHSTFGAARAGKLSIEKAREHQDQLMQHIK